MKKLLSLFILIFIMTVENTAQEKILHGYVLSFENIPVSGAEIKVKSTRQTVLSDSAGYFAVPVMNEDKLIVRANGFFRQKVKIKKPNKVALINLRVNPNSSSKPVSTGFAKVNQDEKVSAVAGIHDDEFNFSVYNNIYDLIKGRIPGVEVFNGEVIIRGVNSINSSSAATIIVDGITTDSHILESISPDEVKSISAIKDGSAAIYGFKGSNGVIIIETKSARR